MLDALEYLRDVQYMSPLVLRARRLYLEHDGNICLDILHVPRRHYTAEQALHRIEWLAPEEVEFGERDIGSTIYLLGILILELANGVLPPLPSSAARAARAIVNDPPPQLDKQGRWSTTMISFVARCLVKDRSARGTIHELQLHPWLRDSSKAPLASLYSQRPGFDADDDGPTVTSAPSLAADSAPDTSTPRTVAGLDEDGSNPTNEVPTTHPQSSWSYSDIAAVAASGVVTGALLVLAYAIVSRAHSSEKS